MVETRHTGYFVPFSLPYSKDPNIFCNGVENKTKERETESSKRDPLRSDVSPVIPFLDCGKGCRHSGKRTRTFT